MQARCTVRRCRIDELTDGGAPRLGEPLPLELANATYAVRGRLQDGLTRPAHLGAWLRDARHRLATPLSGSSLLRCGDAELGAAREIRDCTRALAEASIRGRHPAPAVVAALNSHVRAAPRWHELTWRISPHAVMKGSAPAVFCALAEIAEEAVLLFAGPDRDLIRQCPAPGCVLYFLREHPRREWCSAACGNRVRAARHYDKTRSGAG
jgi:predicted RNA-binding Zn ribbon-like protein